MEQFISHAEIPATDLEKSKEFYKQLFGWDFKPFGNGYYLFNSHKGTTIGLRKAENIQTSNTTIFHINVLDISKILNSMPQGGKIVRDKTIIPAMGYYSLIADLDGNNIGLFQPNR